MNAPGKLSLENQEPRPATPVERELRALRRKLAELQGETLEQMEAREFEEYCSRPAPEDPSVARIRVQAEAAREQHRRTLAQFGANEDADENLQVFLAALPFDGYSPRTFASLVLAISGRELDREADPRDIVDAWPKLTSAVQATLANVARQYSQKHHLSLRSE